MNLDIFKNSFFVAFLTFIVSYVLFYLIGVGYEITVVDGKQTRQMSIKYPLAFTLIIWLLWQFYLFPNELFPLEEQKQMGGSTDYGVKNIEGVGTIGSANPTGILMNADGISLINSNYKSAHSGLEGPIGGAMMENPMNNSNTGGLKDNHLEDDQMFSSFFNNSSVSQQKISYDRWY